MAKIFDIDYRKGSLTDSVTGTTGTADVGVTIEKGNKGLELNLPLNKQISFGNICNLGSTGDFSIVVWFTYKKESGSIGYWNDLFAKGIDTIATAKTWGIVVNQDSTVRQVVYQESSAAGGSYSASCNIASGTTLHENVSYSAIIVRTQTTITSYLNNVLGTTINATRTDLTNSSNLTNGLTNTRGKAAIIRSMLFNHALTEQERAELQRDFLNSYPIVKEKYPNVINKPSDLSREKENTLGAEIISNTTFDTTDGWTLATSWLPGNGKVSFNATANGGCYISTPLLTVGKRYRATFEITDVVTNASLAILSSNGVTTYSPYTSYSNGTYTVDFSCTSLTNPNISFSASKISGGAFSLAFFSIKELTGLVAAYNMIPVGNTLVDISGNGRNGTIGTGFISTSSGLNSSAKGLITLSSIPVFGTGDFTVSFRVYMKSISPIKEIITGATNSLGVYNSNGTILISKVGTGDITQSGFFIANQWSTITLVRQSGQLSGYRNATLQLSPTADARDYSTAFTTIFGYPTGTLLNDGEIADLRIYNRALTLQEIKNYHNSFVQPSLVVDFSDEGADGVAKVPSGWVKQSGSFKIGEWIPKVGELVTNGGFDADSGWTKGLNNTISGGTLNINTTPGNQAVQLISTIAPGKKFRVKFTCTSYTSGSLQVVVGGTAFWSGIPTAGQTYTAESSTVGSNTNFVFNPNTAGTNTFSIDNVSLVEIQPLPTFTNGTKYLECVTAGVIAIPSKQAYGTWEFDYYKLDGNQLRVFITSDKSFWNNGYQVYSLTDERIYLSRNTGGIISQALMYTNTAYTSFNTWYRIRVTRSLTGVFTVYIKGGSFGATDWTLVSVTGGSGTNPVTDTTYTTSEYFVLDIDAGDRIANIICYDGIKQ